MPTITGAVQEGGKIIGHTIQCPHCGMHFINDPERAHVRGRCDCAPSEVVCGKKLCKAVCFTKEERMALVEGGRKDDKDFALKCDAFSEAVNRINDARGEMDFDQFNEIGIVGN